MILYRFLYPIGTRFVHLIAHVAIAGTEQMPRRGGVLLVSNHLTTYDPVILGMAFKRYLHFMAKIELFQIPLFGGLITALGAFPVRRGEADRAALRRAEELLRSGRVVVIFPEGHRSERSALQPGHAGIALLARRTGVPILPVAITGTEHFLPRALPCWRPWRRPAITVTVGAPFHLPETEGRPDYDALAAFIMGRIASLLPLSYRGIYAEHQE